MNTCSYCGAEYPDEVIECPIDGTRMVEVVASSAAERISIRQRTVLWSVAWGVAAVLTAIGARSWAGLWAFPTFSPPGFLAGWILHSANSGSGWYFASTVGWLYYAGLTVWGLRAERGRSFYCAFVILCVSLLLNCAVWYALWLTDSLKPAVPQ